MKKYTIYMHKNKIDGKMYIGQTCQKVERRWSNGSRYETCPIFWRAIQKYGWDNFEHIILKENLTSEEANYWEKYYISFYHTWIKDPECHGYNISKGGGSKKDQFKTKEEIKEKNSQIMKEKWSNPDFRQKVLNGMKKARQKHFEETGQKNWMSLEQKEKLRQLAKEKIETGIFDPGMTRKAVRCIETNEIFASGELAAKWCGLQCGTHISACANGKRKSAGKHPETGAPLHWERIEGGKQTKMQLFQMTEWISPTGEWHCGCVDNLKENSNAWYLPARILKMSPAEYLSFVIKIFKPDNISVLNKDSNNLIIIFTWKNQKDMRQFKNYINKMARRTNFQI